MRDGEPLDVNDVGFDGAQSSQSSQMLDQFKRQTTAGALKEARRERVEQLSPAIRGYGSGPETKARSDQLDICPGSHERRRQLVVVLRREA
jgi:hypothetical protein